MTLGSREGIGVDGRRNSSRKPEGCEEEEDGETGSEDRDTKGDGAESLHPSTAGSPGLPGPVPPGPVLTEPGPGSAPPPLTSTEPTPPSHDQHHFLRSSVRPPSKRIRKDSVGPAGDGPGGSRSRGAEGGSSSQGASGPSGSAAGAAAGGVSKASRGPADKEEQAGNQKRARRQWESWSAEDKNSFFEGLYEHGKDFEAIQNNIAMKYKKRGKPANMVKNKEQVRHFYYRTWHKISKHIDFANVYTRVLKKSSQELYGLICYAELRKKVGGLMDDKNVTKLNELIQNGATTVRSKGRNLRIKAPMCRALKKLCDPDGMSEEEDQRPARLPLKVAVELQPRTNHSWARVQSLAHNPRLRMMVELHRTVASLIEYLKHKWAFHDERIVSSRPYRSTLFLYPAECSTVTALPGVARVVHSKASCTVHWQESGRARPGGGARPGAKDLQTAQILGIHGPAPPPRGGPRAGRGADPRRAEPPPASDPPAEPGGDERKAPPPVAPPPSQTSSGPKVEAGNGEGPDAWAGPPEETGGGPPGAPSPGPERRPCGGVEDTPAAAPSPDTKPPGARGEEGGAPRPPSALEEKERLAEAIREGGWSVGGADGVTLAELYLMLGRPSKLQLEYEWQPAPPPPDPAPAGPPAPQPRPPSANRVLRCLLRLVATEVNPKPLAPEQGSSAPSPLKLPQEEQSGALTPPGKGPAPAVRSPGCGRQPPSLRGPKALLPNAAAGRSRGRHLPRSLLGAAPGGDQEGGVFAIPTTLPPNSSRHSRMFSPNKEAQLAFRQQLDSISVRTPPPPPPISTLFSHSSSPQTDSRTLLPRTTGDTPPHVCSFSILSNSPAAGTGGGTSCGSGPPPPRGRDPVLPPPSVASLLDISLPGPPEESMPPGDGHAHISDSIIELAINSSHFGEDSALSSTKLGSSNGSKLLAASPPGSPSHGWIPSPSHDPQWYPSDSSDSTLGCLLSSLVSPDKGRRPCPSGPSSGTALLGPSLLDCNSHDSFQSRGLPDVAEMDSQLACMMSESSVDYIARFNDLAQELAVTEPSHPPPP
uniref:Cramped chromatin regulator homolog 1 n=1 Tax=Gadus morhua TaxID=8049 RepID=A0A8C5AG99_GADMO